jgi:hypothetical protein
MDADKMSAQELRSEVKWLRSLMASRGQTFIYTETGKSPRSPQMCYRQNMPYTPMDRWVRCHLVLDQVVLGPRPPERKAP